MFFLETVSTVCLVSWTSLLWVLFSFFFFFSSYYTNCSFCSFSLLVLFPINHLFFNHMPIFFLNAASTLFPLLLLLLFLMVTCTYFTFSENPNKIFLLHPKNHSNERPAGTKSIDKHLQRDSKLFWVLYSIVEYLWV